MIFNTLFIYLNLLNTNINGQLINFDARERNRAILQVIYLLFIK